MFGNIFDQSVPGQLYHIHLQGGNTVLAEPTERFSSAVFYYWLMQIDDNGANLEVVPDGALDLVLSPLIPNFSVVYPPAIRKFNIPLAGPAIYTGISFEPEYAQQFLQADLEHLSHLAPGLPTTEALDLLYLTSEIQGQTDIQTIKAKFDQLLIDKNLTPSKRLKQSAYQCFVDELDVGGAREIAERLGISERQFRRTINDISGLPPKQVQRIVRLQQILHEMFKAESLKGEDGFYDDSHRIREIKELTGMTYGDLRKMAEIYNNSN